MVEEQAPGSAGPPGAAGSCTTVACGGGDFSAQVQDRARVRALRLDDGGVAALALLVVGPHGAGEVVVVAVAPCADGGTLERKAKHD